MKVSTVMSREVVTIAPDAELDEALRRMDDGEVRHLPVVENDRLVGVLSERDLLEETGWLPRAVRDAIEAPSRLVGDLMHRPVVFATPSDSLVSASMRLLEWGVGCLPVLTGPGVVGMVSEVDLLEAYAEACRDATHTLDDPPVETRMSVGVHCAGPTTPADEAREFMRSKNIRHLPITEEVAGADGGVLIGMVSARDLALSAGRGQLEGTPLRELVSSPVRTTSPDARISRAAAEMATLGVGALPVVDQERLVGLVSTADLLGHFVEAFSALDEEARAKSDT